MGYNQVVSHSNFPNIIRTKHVPTMKYFFFISLHFERLHFCLFILPLLVVKIVSEDTWTVARFVDAATFPTVANHEHRFDVKYIVASRKCETEIP